MPARRKDPLACCLYSAFDVAIDRHGRATTEHAHHHVLMDQIPCKRPQTLTLLVHLHVALEGVRGGVDGSRASARDPVRRARLRPHRLHHPAQQVVRPRDAAAAGALPVRVTGHRRCRVQGSTFQTESPGAGALDRNAPHFDGSTPIPLCRIASHMQQVQ